MQILSLLLWPTLWPPGSWSTGAPSSWAVSSTLHSQPITNHLQMDELKQGGGDSIASCSFGGTRGSVASWFFWRHFFEDNFLGGRLPTFCLPFFWLFLAWLGIPILGSNFWDPHQKQNSNSVFYAGYSGRNFFWIPLLKSHQIGIPIPKYGIPNFVLCRNSIHLILHETLIAIAQLADLTMLNCMDIGTIPSKDILPPN